ncbi:sensor histidine kinase [Streptomyces sp. NPDC048340]|uniref:sensor histidine kinase n=1 Tax=Streptomyces sp. NPDC048340 TaxID=3365537 RepID=UPI00371F8CA7
MRWALVRVCLAVTVMVVAAFAVPLGAAVQQMARDRAFTGAERQAATIGPVLTVTTDRGQVEKAVASTQPGAESGMAVHMPRDPYGAPDSGWDIGEGRAPASDVAAVRDNGQVSRAAVRGGWVVLQPTALGAGRMAVVEVFVPQDAVGEGVATAWLVLGAVAAALLLGSVAVADRLGVRVVRPAERLARAAHELGEGRLAARVVAGGPAELRAAGVAFNSMADQVVALLEAERELAADLSHRLRTPLTVLRLNAASLGDGQAAEQTRAAVEQLEREVDTIIRTAREQRPRTSAAQGGEIPGCDAVEVIRERMEFWSALAEDEGREARLAGVAEPVRLPVARAELTACLDAMLGNVFRHTPLGAAFAVDVHRGEDAVIVMVSDAGGGIAEPDAALSRGNDGERQGSTGLGLDIVRRLAESTGGDVSVGRSVLGGAEIRVRFLRDARQADARAQGRARGRRRAGAQSPPSAGAPSKGAAARAHRARSGAGEEPASAAGSAGAAASGSAARRGRRRAARP